ncbi:LysR family transcriptional regulator [Cupriavidus sp. NPDC089707]|uniref:LysR family transcriptional regulator n=1 Tax=Cupriavidus sp. NPDC089707 TaxID=3363963 RepID=UPI00380E8796
MDIRQIRAFLAIADTGTVTRAAELLHVVQPAVSRQIKLLEDEIAAPLFVRTRHGMQLTDAGQVLSERARRALRELDMARMEIHPEAQSISGVVQIGLLPSSCDLIADALVRALQQNYPQVRVSISVGYTDHLLRWLENGEVEAALLYNPAPTPALDIAPLVEETLSLAGPAALRLEDMVPVPISALGQTPLVLPSAPHGLRSLVEHACAVAGVEITVAAETNALSVQKQLVVSGYGLTVLPRIAVRDEIQRGQLSAAPIDGSDFTRRIALATPASRRMSPALRCATSTLRACMMEIASSGDWLGARWIPD